MTAQDLIGKRDEAIATGRLMDFCGNPYPYFDVHPSGEKCPTFDCLVELVHAGSSVPYFLAQVKSTQKGFTKKERRLIVEGWARKMFGEWSGVLSPPTSSE
jgi:hypothetical protein